MLQVRSVVILSCPDLTLGLDFQAVNPTHIPVTVQRCGKVKMDFIIFDQSWADHQTLRIHFQQVENVTFSHLHLDHVSYVSRFASQSFKVL